ncbi:MAG: hypothetical protein PVS2B3_13740 [Steroidobacteraceae bacterium]
MLNRRPGLAVLAMLALTCAVGRADESRKGAPENPDAGFLEFLGSVDRLAEVNPDYLSQPDRPRITKAPAKGAVSSPAPSPPPTAASGVKNNG